MAHRPPAVDPWSTVSTSMTDADVLQTSPEKYVLKMTLRPRNLQARRAGKRKSRHIPTCPTSGKHVLRSRIRTGGGTVGANRRRPGFDLISSWDPIRLFAGSFHLLRHPRYAEEIYSSRKRTGSARSKNLIPKFAELPPTTEQFGNFRENRQSMSSDREYWGMLGNNIGADAWRTEMHRRYNYGETNMLVVRGQRMVSLIITRLFWLPI